MTQDSMQRRVYRQGARSSDINGLNDVIRLMQDRSGLPIADMNRQKAREILEDLGRYGTSSVYADFDDRTRDVVRLFAREDDFGMTKVANEATIAMTEQAQEDYRVIKSLQGLQEIESRYPVAPPPASTATSAGATAAPTPPPSAGSRASYVTPNATTYRNIINSAGVASPTAGPDHIYTRMGRMFKSGGMSDLFSDSIIRNSAYAVAGLAVFGFVYSAFKERTAEQIEGPPLLPGGSAYESDFPKSLPSISDLKYLNPTTAAMSYKIHLSGSQADAEKMQRLAGGVATGPINTTMYDGLPRLGRDPYSNIASSF